MKDKEYFDDYYDEDGNLHIDARKPYQKNSETINLKVNISDIDNSSEKPKKLIIHHVDLTNYYKEEKIIDVLEVDNYIKEHPDVRYLLVKHAGVSVAEWIKTSYKSYDEVPAIYHFGAYSSRKHRKS